ncbi:MAG: hypothetical protein AABZ02_05375 [Bacteroidota bacterium]
MDQSTDSGSQPAGQPPQQPPQAQAQPKPQPLGYEFTVNQNETIRILASRMKFVGVFYIVVGVLFGFFGLIALFFYTFVGIVYIIAIVPQLLIGIWTTNAASSFRQVVDTKGHDIPYLMNALVSLRKLFTLQFWLLILTLVFIVLAIAAGIFLWMSGSLPLPVERTTVTMLAF